MRTFDRPAASRYRRSRNDGSTTGASFRLRIAHQLGASPRSSPANCGKSSTAWTALTPGAVTVRASYGRFRRPTSKEGERQTKGEPTSERTQQTMSRRSLWAAAVVVAAAAVFAAGCGGGGSKSSESTTQSTPTGGASGTKPAGGAKKGGTAHFNLATDTDYIDPALAYYEISWQFEYATCAKLLNYPDTSGAAGSQLQPEVAQSLPTISADGKTYTFTVRSGFKFSPPSNE